MEATVNAYQKDTINVQSSIDDSEIILSIWSNRSHQSTYLTKDMVEELIKYLELAKAELEGRDV